MFPLKCAQLLTGSSFAVAHAGAELRTLKCRKTNPVLTGRSCMQETCGISLSNSSSHWVSPEVAAECPAWYALYTNPRHEKRVASQLAERSLECFLPLYRSMRRWNDRSRLLDLPLFPGYLFVHIELAQKLRVLSISGAVRLVGVGNSPQALPDDEIQQIRKLLLANPRMEPHPYLRVGSRVRVSRGPLEGTEGCIIRYKNHYRVVISVHLIQRSVAVELDALDLTSMPEPVSRTMMAA